MSEKRTVECHVAMTAFAEVEEVAEGLFLCVVRLTDKCKVIEFQVRADLARATDADVSSMVQQAMESKGVDCTVHDVGTVAQMLAATVESRNERLMN